MRNIIAIGIWWKDHIIFYQSHIRNESQKFHYQLWLSSYRICETKDRKSKNKCEEMDA